MEWANTLYRNYKDHDWEEWSESRCARSVSSFITDYTRIITTQVLSHTGKWNWELWDRGEGVALLGGGHKFILPNQCLEKDTHGIFPPTTKWIYSESMHSLVTMLLLWPHQTKLSHLPSFEVTVRQEISSICLSIISFLLCKKCTHLQICSCVYLLQNIPKWIPCVTLRICN